MNEEASIPDPGGTGGSTTWISISLVILVPVVCLAPFLNKAYHVDDTVFVWVARQIERAPADFFGFEANWYGRTMPMYDINKNPPGVSYYLAAVFAACGEGERFAHLALLLPAVAVSLGTYVLARRLCARPALAAVSATLTPAFLVSSSNVMSDTLMMAFYVWAAALWVHGLDRKRSWMLVLSGVLIGLSALAKYYGLSLVVLLLIYGALRERRVGGWILPMLIPLAMFAAYEIYVYQRYGLRVSTDLVSYVTATNLKQRVAIFTKSVVGITFVGGCLISALFFAPQLWSYRGWIAGALVAAVCMGAVLATNERYAALARPAGTVRWLYLAQWYVFLVAGLFVLSLAIGDVWRRRDADAVLLVLWVVGAFVFSTVVNWTTNARTILPMAPAVGILVARRLDLRAAMPKARGLWRCVLPLIGGALVSLCVLWGDYAWANSAREAAFRIRDTFTSWGGTIRYEGHWGFQYYMEAIGAKPLTFENDGITLDMGDMLVIPSNNSKHFGIPPDWLRPAGRFELPACPWLSTMNLETGAAFYSDMFGPLPYVFGATPPERYAVFQIIRTQAVPVQRITS